FGATFALAAQGLRYAGARRDATWARLISADLLRREAEDPDNPGIPLDVPERWEAAQLLRASTAQGSLRASADQVFADRDAALATDDPLALVFWAGEYAAA